MGFQELYDLALSLANRKKINERTTVGQVAVAMLCQNGKVYTGISLETYCSLGFCAEEIAIGKMIQDNENRILKMIAVNSKGLIYSPCGKCRELIYQINNDNLLCEVKLENKIMTLEELLPEL